MRLAAILVSSLAVSGASYAPAAGQELNLDAMAAQPGAQVTKTVNKDGSEVTEVKLPSGVLFHRELRDGKAMTSGHDLSGHGAVLCSWGLYVEVAAALEVCPEVRNEPLRADMATAIDRINDFIVANSLFPVTKAELEKRAASRREDAQLCQPGGVVGMIKSAGLVSRDKLMSNVADLLSVPRPPVINPCL